MRILFLAGRDPAHPQCGGGDDQAWRWAAWCAQRGHSVTFVCQDGQGLAKTDVVEGVRVIRLGNGVNLAMRAYRWFGREGPFDLVYEDPIGAGRTPYFSPLYTRTPTIAVWHQVSEDLLKLLHGRLVGTVMAVVERLVAVVYRRTQLWIPSEERAEEVIERLRMRRNQITVIPPTVDRSWLAEPTPHAREATVLFLGVMRRYKNVADAVRAFAAIHKDLPAAKLILAGRSSDGRYVEELEELVRSLGVSDKVTFELDISEARKRELLDTSRALVLPSALEGFGIVTIEAHARGTPVLASSGVPRAATIDGVDGLRFQTGDIDGLATAMRSILTRDDVFRRLSSGAEQSARSYVTDVVAADFERLMERTLRAQSTVP